MINRTGRTILNYREGGMSKPCVVIMIRTIFFKIKSFNISMVTTLFYVCDTRTDIAL